MLGYKRDIWSLRELNVSLMIGIHKNDHIVAFGCKKVIKELVWALIYVRQTHNQQHALAHIIWPFWVLTLEFWRVKVIYAGTELLRLIGG